MDLTSVHPSFGVTQGSGVHLAQNQKVRMVDKGLAFVSPLSETVCRLLNPWPMLAALTFIHTVARAAKLPLRPEVRGVV